MDKHNFQFSLQVSIIKEGNSYVAFSPALDLSTVADTQDEAQKRFEEAVQIFFEEINEKGTVEQALTELGWQKHDKHLTPPSVVKNQTKQFSIPLSVNYA